jgi:hypothetical protein
MTTAPAARKPREKDNMNNWPGLTNNQTSDLACEMFFATMNAIKHGDPLPGDERLNARLRELGCPETDLATWRVRVRKTTWSKIVKSAARNRHH